MNKSSKFEVSISGNGNSQISLKGVGIICGVTLFTIGYTTDGFGIIYKRLKDIESNKLKNTQDSRIAVLFESFLYGLLGGTKLFLSGLLFPISIPLIYYKNYINEENPGNSNEGRVSSINPMYCPVFENN
jgi:hypothetical protein